MGCWDNMKIKFLQLNIEKGRFLDRVIKFIEDQNFDIINFQEVSGGVISYGKVDNLKILQKSLNDYAFAFAPAYKRSDDPNSYQGNLVLVKKNYQIVNHKTIWYKSFLGFTEIESQNFPSLSRNALAVKIKLKDRFLWSICAHLPWTARSDIESAARLELSQKINNFLKSTSDPFVFSGDFNALPMLKSVADFSEVAENLIIKNKITNTLNPRAHRAAAFIFPKGAAVDYILTSLNLKIISFQVLEEIDFSDHFALLAEFEI